MISDDVGVIYLAAGTGSRAPGGRMAPGYLRSKSVVRFLGRRLIDWQFDTIQSMGITKVIVVTRLKENRQQTRDRLGYRRGGVDVRYTPSSFDLEVRGSADATRDAILQMRREWPRFVKKYTLVIPCDQFFMLNLEKMVTVHEQKQASLTLADELQPVSLIAATYGWIMPDAKDPDIVRELVEKPSMEEMAGRLQVPVASLETRLERMSDGLYLFGTEEFLEITSSGPFEEFKRELEDQQGNGFTGVDFGKHYLHWLPEQGRTIARVEVDELGDLGNIKRFIAAQERALNGGYDLINKRFNGSGSDCGQRVQVDDETLDWRCGGMTLRERIAQGAVRLSNSRIGRFVRIHGTPEHPVIIDSSSIEDEVEVYEGVEIRSSHVGRNSHLGTHARIERSYVGVEVGIQSSSLCDRTSIRHFAVLQDTVTICPGTTLCGQHIGPRLTVRASDVLPAIADVTDPVKFRYHTGHYGLDH